MSMSRFRSSSHRDEPSVMPQAASRSPSAMNIAPPNPSEPATAELATSTNPIAAGIAEVLQAIATASSRGQSPPSTPIMIECGERVMALGRKRMAAMNGRNAFLYLKSKFGLLSTSNALYLSASFVGDSQQQFVEVDMDAWGELVPYIERLRIV
ncbi:hypothetical protein CC2G_008962 [Coprinopsis cinerea AmutBmut pab1-1]|nr:hypothetical protein CC2G_008962 [Coprinopsis cinerea AmutBmut pab1-1]